MIEKYKPLFIHLNPASIPEVVAHIQKYLIEHEFVTVDDFGTQFQEYIDAHPDIIKVGSVNGLTGDVVLTSENITMTGGTSESIGTVIGDILEEASSTGETVDDLVIDMDTAKTNIASLTSDVATLENVFVGATAESSGVKGLVPAPTNTQTQQYLKATGNFETVSAGEVASSAVSGAGTVETALSIINSGAASVNVGNLPLTNYTLSGSNVLYEKIFTDGGTYLVVGSVHGNITPDNLIDIMVVVDNTLFLEPVYGKFNDVFGGAFAVLVTNSFKINATSPVVPGRVVLRYQYIRLK